MLDVPVIPMRDTFGAIVTAPAGGTLAHLSPDTLQNLFGQYGAILLRGFEADTDGFLRFTEQFCQDFSTYQGGALRWKGFDRKMIDNIPTLLTTTGHNQSFPIPLHGEMYYVGRRPDTIWFRCVEAPIVAGETIVCDGQELASTLSETTRSLLTAKRLMYIRELPAEAWPVAFQTDSTEELAQACATDGTKLEIRDDGSVRTEYVCSAFGEGGAFINSILPLTLAELAFEQGFGSGESSTFSEARFPVRVRLEDGSRLPQDALEDIEQRADEVMYAVKWQDGDVLMVDNHRVMHGRLQSVDGPRTIHVRMGMTDGEVHAP